MNQRVALIIDDEPDVSAYLSSVLSEHGWQARIARNGDAGLASARADSPDVILLDLLMPGGRGGLSTFMELRRDPDLKAIPVIIVSAFNEPAVGDPESFLGRQQRYRPDAYLEKPVDPDELITVLDEVTAPDRDPDVPTPL